MNDVKYQIYKSPGSCVPRKEAFIAHDKNGMFFVNYCIINYGLIIANAGLLTLFSICLWWVINNLIP